MEVIKTSENCTGWMIIENRGVEYLFIAGKKVAHKKETDIYFYTLSIDSMMYKCALTKFLCLGWKDVEKLRDKQINDSQK